MTEDEEKIVFTEGTDERCCMTCNKYASWYDIFYQEDPDEPGDHGECYEWYDDYPGYGGDVCDKWEDRRAKQCH